MSGVREDVKKVYYDDVIDDEEKVNILVEYVNKRVGICMDLVKEVLSKQILEKLDGLG